MSVYVCLTSNGFTNGMAANCDVGREKRCENKLIPTPGNAEELREHVRRDKKNMRRKLRRERGKNSVLPQPQAVKKTPAVTVKKTRAVTALSYTSSAVKKTGAVTTSAASSSHTRTVTSEMPACERNLYKYTGNY